MSASPSLSLVAEVDPVEDGEETLKTLDQLVDELAAERDALLEEIDCVREAIGMSKIDYELFKGRGFVLPKPKFVPPPPDLSKELSESLGETKRLREHVVQNAKDMDKVVDKLEAYLGRK